MTLPDISVEEIQHELDHQYDTRQEWVYASIATAAFFSILAVVLRVMARRKQGMNLAWNDYTMIVALVNYMTQTEKLAVADSLIQLFTLAMCGAFVRGMTFALSIATRTHSQQRPL